MENLSSEPAMPPRACTTSSRRSLRARGWSGRSPPHTPVARRNTRGFRPVQQCASSSNHWKTPGESSGSGRSSRMRPPGSALVTEHRRAHGVGAVAPDPVGWHSLSISFSLWADPRPTGDRVELPGRRPTYSNSGFQNPSPATTSSRTPRFPPYRPAPVAGASRRTSGKLPR